MRRRIVREYSMEEFEAWREASDGMKAVGKAADEEGGPRLSLVPADDRAEVWPADLLAPAPNTAQPGDAAPDSPGPDLPACDSPACDPPNPIPPSSEPAPAAMPFDGVVLEDSRKRLAGWSAERQRLFLWNLAETGSVHLACAAARLSARSAYRLRARSPGFAAAFDTAQQLAIGRLSALAFDRAINGSIEQVWQQGELVAEKRMPSDKLLMWLLARLDPRRFGAPWEARKEGAPDPQAEAHQAFAGLLDALADAASD
jgi:hypothetical protein